MDGIKERCKVEREVIFYGDDGNAIAKETKFRGKDGCARFVVEYRVGDEWTCRSAEAQPGAAEAVRNYRESRIKAKGC